MRRFLPDTALLDIGFRLFFLGAAVYAVISVAVWTGVYVFGFEINTGSVSIIQWHAHEMIYGYSLAVIAGFLLTAVRNWTGLSTSEGLPLLLMFCFWCGARMLYLFGTEFLMLAGILDLMFLSQLSLSVIVPVVRKKQWVRMAVLSKVVLLFVFSALFVLGTQGWVSNGVKLGIYGGFYLVIGLILTFGRKVIPFFIERGVGYPVTVFNSRWFDLTSMALFVLFFFLELLGAPNQCSAYTALGLCIVNSLRLAGWHTRGIWAKPLLWGLYLSYCFICLGFLLYFLAYQLNISKFIAIHALAFGGIGNITLSMMSRVALGHTGRNISNVPITVPLSFLLLITGSILRVILPLLNPGHYVAWIGLSQFLWIAAFMVFLWTYTPILLRPRVDQ